MIKPWNLTQISINDKESFKACLLDILNEGRKLTPFEIAKLQEFLDKIK